MPSDPRLPQALAALAQPIGEFRAIIEGALTQGEAFRAAQEAGVAERARVAEVSLGAFAAGRVDPGGFAALFPPVPTVDADALTALDRALGVLRVVRAMGDALFVAEVPAGARMGEAVERAIGTAGRALGAAVLIEIIRGGRYTAEQDKLLQPHEFRSWNRAERRFAPPLVVVVDGGDVQPGALLEFVDGREKLVLVIQGASAPAPLARCISPGTFVLQSADGSGLERIAGVNGPAIAALVPPEAALFVHDPAAGKEPWQRLTVAQMPAAPTKPVGGLSVWQMAEDLRVVANLATTPFSVPTGSGASPALGADDATAKIAAWLLGQSGMQGGAA